jgi:hypothetical protein
MVRGIWEENMKAIFIRALATAMTSNVPNEQCATRSIDNVLLHDKSAETTTHIAGTATGDHRNNTPAIYTPVTYNTHW